MSHLSLYQGKVKSYKAITKNSVQIELHDIPNIFELYIDQSWVIDRDDKVILVGHRVETGKYYCCAYSNLSKNIKGWKRWLGFATLFALACIVLLFPMAFILVGATHAHPILFFGFLLAFILFSAFNKIRKSNKFYKRAYDMLG